MNRKLKALGLALFAMMALGAIAAQGASAEGSFHSEIEGTYITGIQEENTKEFTNEFQLDDGNGSSLTCSEAVFEGFIEKTTVTEVELTPTYSGCETNGGAGATVNHTECKYVLSADTVGEHAPVSIVCPEGQGIHITISGICPVTVTPDNSISEGVVYHNIGTSGNERDITATITAHDINWEVTGSEFLCTLGGLGASSGTDATYFSRVTVKGYEKFDPAEGEVPAKHTNQVGIWHTD